jgi:hypothetical protein
LYHLLETSPLGVIGKENGMEEWEGLFEREPVGRRGVTTVTHGRLDKAMYLFIDQAM